MLSRSLDYGQNSYDGFRYDGTSSYNNNPMNLPSFAPLSFSNQQAYPYSFHKVPQALPNQYDKYYQSLPNQPPQQNSQSRINEGKNFIDGFDNNASGLLNQEKSHARNMKRLFNNDDPTTEQIKNQQKNSYREELQRQIEETKRKKQEQKQKIQKEEIQRERKFYEQFKIQAQVKEDKGEKKEDNGYFMIRTVHKFKRQKNQQSDLNAEKDNIESPTNYSPNPPIKVRGKTYQNKSSLDTWDNPQNKPNAKKSEQESPNDNRGNKQRVQHRFSKMEEEIMKERKNQQERLSKLLLFQQRVLQKITDIKTEIRNTALDIDCDKELMRVRNNLRAKPIPLDDDFFKTNVRKNNFDTNHYYSLPKREPRLQGTRYSVKLKDSRKDSPEKSVNSEVTDYVNDKNKRTNQPAQQNQQIA